MTHRFRNAISVGAAAIWFSFPAGAPQPQPGPTHDPEAHHRDMLTRGAQAMGFDQERTVHHFLLYEDGGAIEVAVKEASDHANLHAIRQHLPGIAELFKAGDFDKPALTHAQLVPGTVEMTRLKERITYQYEGAPAGGGVRIVTRDAPALATLTGVSTDTLRHYERKQVLAIPGCSQGGYRPYPPEAVAEVRLVRRALAIGFTLSDLVACQSATVAAHRARASRTLVAERLAELETRLRDLTARRSAHRANAHGARGRRARRRGRLCHARRFGRGGGRRHPGR
jgi:DNA-binding transcriptional MerR regulator